jgi:hypothetical protein
MLRRQRPYALWLVLAACSSSTGPRPGLPGPDGTFLTTKVHETVIRVGDTTRVDLIILNTTSQVKSFAPPVPFPTVRVIAPNGDSIPVTYPNVGLGFAEFSIAPGKSTTALTILGAGTAVNGATAVANLTPGVYSVAACMGGCGQPVSLTVTP